MAATTVTDSNQKRLIENPDEMQKIFNQFDANKDGKISVTELANVLKSIGSSYTEEDLLRVMDELDTDKDGFINFSEFATLCQTSSGEVELRDAFDLYDQDRNGLISAEELNLVLNKLGKKFSVDECVAMIKPVDADGDGNVNFEEFRTMMTSSSLKPAPAPAPAPAP